MLIEVDALTYYRNFPNNFNPFLSESFIELNQEKADKVLRLIDDEDKPVMGLIAGEKEGFMYSPFSAPFGGFHFKNENMYISKIEDFLKSLQQYIISQKLKGIYLTLPPSIYHETFNAKTVSCLHRTGFQPTFPEITNWINLDEFGENFKQKNSREYYRQALRNELSFSMSDDVKERRKIYNLIKENRKKFGRPIYMTFEDIIKAGELWSVDFFKVTSREGELVASAIFYRCHPGISYAVFWGDNDEGRTLRAMDFLAFQLWNHYKGLNYKYIDLGISTEQGTPNEGLLRFKESHDATSSLRYRFSWKPKD